MNFTKEVTFNMQFDINDLNLPDFENLVLPPPNIPDPSATGTSRLISAFDELQRNNLISEIEQLSYDVKVKETLKNNYKQRLSSIVSSSNIVAGIWCSIIVAILSIVIPFLIVAFNNYLEPFKDIIFAYMIISFILSMLILLIYLVYSYKK